MIYSFPVESPLRGYPVPHRIITLPFDTAALVSLFGLTWIFAAMPDFTGIAAGITAVGFAAVGVYAFFNNRKIEAWKAMQRADIEMTLERDRALGGSISCKLDQTIVLLRDAVASRDEYKHIIEAGQQENRDLTAGAVKQIENKIDSATRPGSGDEIKSP
jgi:hypothetical protein